MCVCVCVSETERDVCVICCMVKWLNCSNCGKFEMNVEDVKTGVFFCLCMCV